MTTSAPVTKETDVPIVKPNPIRQLPIPEITPMPIVIPDKEPEKVPVRRHHEEEA